MPKKGRLVYGVGVNDSSYPISSFSLVDGVMRQTWVCPIYTRWRHMLQRCYCDKFKKRYPTYVGCSVVKEWHSFSKFKEWMEGHDYYGKELDKDILVRGNKVYGPDTCIFVSQELNKFMNHQNARRGASPLGVSYVKRLKKFQSMCVNPFTMKNEHLGVFADENQAHQAWRKRKHQLACIYAENQNDPRIAHALRNRYASDVGF